MRCLWGILALVMLCGCQHEVDHPALDRPVT